MKKEILEWVKTIILSAIIALIITTFIKPTIVRQYSMSPTLNEYDFLIINRYLYTRGMPDHGDIVVFESDLKTQMGSNKLLIKRVIALPGDELLIQDGVIYLNGQLLSEPYINAYTDGKAYEGQTIAIPDGKFFAMGDNRGNSQDSRDTTIGLVEIDKIVGKAFLRLFPFNQIGFLE